MVPLLQHALADYVQGPAKVNGLLNELNPTYSAAFWHTPVELNNAATKTMLSDKLVADTAGTSTVGGFDMTQVSKIISELVPVNTRQGLTTMNPSVGAADVATNRFLDPSIGVGPLTAGSRRCSAAADALGPVMWPHLR